MLIPSPAVRLTPPLSNAPGGVLFLDLDGRLDAARLPVALSQRVAACRTAAGVSTGLTCGAADGTPLCDPQDPVYAASLARFRLLRCRSSAEVVHIAAVLDRLVAQQGRGGRRSSHSADGDVPELEEVAPTRLLLIDNLVRGRCGCDAEQSVFWYGLAPDE